MWAACRRTPLPVLRERVGEVLPLSGATTSLTRTLTPALSRSTGRGSCHMRLPGSIPVALHSNGPAPTLWAMLSLLTLAQTHATTSGGAATSWAPVVLLLIIGI